MDVSLPLSFHSPLSKNKINTIFKKKNSVSPPTPQIIFCFLYNPFESLRHVITGAFPTCYAP